MSGVAGYGRIVSRTAGPDTPDLFRMRIIEIGAVTFASSGLSCTIHPEADGRVAMGMIRGAIGKASSMEDIGSRKPRCGPGLARDRVIPVAGHECRDPEIDTGVQFEQVPDSSRSRGYGRYEI
jgi:hypothetical protein